MSALPAVRSVGRWWRVDGLYGGLPDVSVAYETAQGLWWEWWPETRMLHPNPHLAMALRLPDELIGEAHRFALLEPSEARALLQLEAGVYQARHDGLMTVRRQEFDCGEVLDPLVVLDCAWLASMAVLSSRRFGYADRGGASFEAYLAGITPQRLRLQKIVAEKLGAEPHWARPVLDGLQR